MSIFHKIADSILDLEIEKRNQILKYWGFVSDYAEYTFGIVLNVRQSEKLRTILITWHDYVKKGVVNACDAGNDYKTHVLNRLDMLEKSSITDMEIKNG